MTRTREEALRALPGFPVQSPGCELRADPLIQRHYPRERLGRVFALVTITVQGFTALSALATGTALGWIEPRELFFVGGVCGATCGVVGITFVQLRTAN